MQLNPLLWSKHWSLMTTCNMASGNYQRQCTSIIHWKTGLCDRKCHLHSQQHGLRTCCTVKLLCTKEINFSPQPFQSLLCERREDIKLRFLSSLHLICLWLWMLHWQILVPWHKHCHSVAQSCLTFCNPMDCSRPGFPVLHHLLEFAQTYVHCVSDAIQPSHPLSPLRYSTYKAKLDPYT